MELVSVPEAHPGLVSFQMKTHRGERVSIELLNRLPSKNLGTAASVGVSPPPAASAHPAPRPASAHLPAPTCKPALPETEEALWDSPDQEAGIGAGPRVASNSDDEQLVDCTGIGSGCTADGACCTGGGLPEAARKSSADGSFWGVQRILGIARSICRWLGGFRRACTVLVASGSELVVGGRGMGYTVLCIVRKSPGLMLAMWPAVSWLNVSPPVHGTGLCTMTAFVCLVVTPWVTGGTGFLHQAVCAGAESVYSLVSCCSHLGNSLTQLATNSSQVAGLVTAATGRRHSEPLDLLAAADFSFTAAAFVHLLISSTIRWRRGKVVDFVHKEIPQDLKLLGNLAKIMYDKDLPQVVDFQGHRLRLLREFTDSVMAVFASEELVNGEGRGDEAVAGQIVVCHRGTWSPRDLVDDLHLLCGTFRSSPRLKDARARSNALLRLWPRCKYTHVGHSLGGAVSMALVKDLPQSVEAEAHAFNPGISFEGFISPRSTIHLIENDVVGFCTPAHPGANCRIYPAHTHTKYMPLWAHQHSVYNFAY